MSDKKKKKKKKSPAKAAKKVTKRPRAAPKAASKPKKKATAARARVRKKTAAPAVATPTPAPTRRTPTPTSASVSVSVSAHPSSLPENPEPTVSNQVPFPMVLVVLLGILFYLADMYVADNAGVFKASVYYPETKIPKVTGGVDGKTTFLANCASCHQLNGGGSKALGFPPLAGSDWVNVAGPDRIIRLVLNGIDGPIKVNGEDYSNAMLSWKDILNDEQIAAVVTYIRSSWGNDASAVTAERVAAIRAEVADRPNPWSAEELLKTDMGE